MQRRLALLIPAHNEGVVIQHTLKSAIRAGLNKQDIFVVDDASSDDTAKKVLEILPSTNLLTVEHSGKAGAISKAIKHFDIEKRYRWMHIADADSVFGNNYFHIYSAALSDRYVAAIGFVQSMRGNWLCTYRSISYTYGQHIVRRIQAALGMISVLPGPVTAYRTDIIKQLDFHTKSLTEDFDITLQIHRKNLGKVRFIPEAVSYTQDPNNIYDYTTQSMRWFRGFFQGLKRYGIGQQMHRIDLAVIVLMFDLLMGILQMSIGAYILLLAPEHLDILWKYILIDLGTAAFFIIFTALATKRPKVLLGIFYFHIIKTFESVLFMRAFMEVVILNRFAQEVIGWKVEGRRYKIQGKALADFA